MTGRIAQRLVASRSSSPSSASVSQLHTYKCVNSGPASGLLIIKDGGANEVSAWHGDHARNETAMRDEAVKAKLNVRFPLKSFIQKSNRESRQIYKVTHVMREHSDEQGMALKGRFHVMSPTVTCCVLTVVIHNRWGNL